MEIKSFNRSLTASFFIARVGQVGKPMWTPYTSTNSFMVFSENPNLDFQKVKAAYESGAFKPYQLGSVQPFIRLSDVREVIERSRNIEERHLRQMALLEQHLAEQEKKLAKQKELFKALQMSVFANC